MFATKLPFCSGGIIHPFCCQGLSSFFLKSGEPLRGRCCQYSQARPPYPPVTARTSEQSLRVERCNSMQSNGLQSRRPLFLHKHDPLFSCRELNQSHPLQIVSLPCQFSSCLCSGPGQFLRW